MINDYMKYANDEQERIGLDVFVHGEPERTDMCAAFPPTACPCLRVASPWGPCMQVHFKGSKISKCQGRITVCHLHCHLCKSQLWPLRGDGCRGKSKVGICS